MRSIFPISLGCPKNLVDTERLLARFQQEGYRIVNDLSQSDTVLINTCGFIAPAIAESETEIAEALELKKSGKIRSVIVAGCLVQRRLKKLQEDFPEIDKFIDLKSLPDEKYARLQVTLPHTAYLKIADGCDNCCSYCTIPSIRGGYRSRPEDDIITEARKLVEHGVKEVSLIAQDTTRYGIDLYNDYCLPKLISRLTKIRGLEWIRLMYVYPEMVSDELLALIAGEAKVCKYLDMPLQHISDPILKSMNRRSSEQTIRDTIERIRQKVPDLALRTNFIVGYPGETEQDFDRLLHFVKEVQFNKVGVFAYSQEAGTPAALMDAQVPEGLKQERYNKLVSLQSKVVDTLNKGLRGKIMTVLLDTADFGRTQQEAPDIDGGVLVSAKQRLRPGTFVPVRITGADGYMLKGVTDTP
jgi:ribosomal protein S12 methylthiotransferase